MLDEALDGVNTLDITVTTAYTLSTASGTTDQARKRTLVISGTATANATVTVPALNKFYVVDCTYTGAYTVTVKTAGDAGVVLKAGDGALLYVTPSGVFEALRKSDMLLASNNLSDLTDKVAARANIGLGNPTINTFTNNGSTLTRTLTQDPGTINAVVVVFDGVVQTPTLDYTLSGTTLTYTTQPVNGTKELIFIGSQSLPAGTASDGSITIPKLSSSVYATNGEALAGTDNTKVMTPLRVKEAITAISPSVVTTPGLVLLDTKTASSSSSLDFTSGIDGTYDVYLFEISLIKSSSGNPEFTVVFSTNGGASWVGGTSYARGGIYASNASGSILPLAASGVSSVSLGSVDSAQPRYRLSGDLTLFNPLDPNSAKTFNFDTNTVTSTGFFSVMGSGVFDSVSPVNAVRFALASGTIVSGIIRMYGYKK